MPHRTSPKNSVPHSAPGHIYSAIPPNPTNHPPAGALATCSRTERLPSGPASRVAEEILPCVHAHLSRTRVLLFQFAAPLDPYAFSRPAQCSSRSIRATTRRTARRNKRSFSALRMSSPAPWLLSAAGPPPLPTIAPHPDTTARTFRRFHPTTIALRPIRSCRSHPSLHSDMAGIRPLMHNVPAHPESPLHNRASPLHQRSSILSAHSACRR